LPIPLDVKEATHDEYGVGISWARDHLEDAEPDDCIFGKNVFGHGAGSGAVLRVAPDLELVVAMARYTPGPRDWQERAKLMKVIADNLAE